MPLEPITSIRDSQLEALVAELYSDALAYHNFQHAIDTIEAADLILQKCAEEGIRIDAYVVYYALLFHDAGFYDDHEALGHANKETYAAELADEHLQRRQVPRKLIDKVKSAIMSTHKDGSFVTAEQKAVRAADLSGLAADYARFVKNSADLKLEYELFHGKKLSWGDWVKNAGATIRFYLAQEIRLTSYFYDENGESAFHKTARRNLEKLVAES